MADTSPLFALVLLAYCFAAQLIALYLTRKTISALKKQNPTMPDSEIPKAKLGSYRSQLRWLKSNFINFPSQTQSSIRIIKAVEASAWLSMASIFTLYLTNNLKDQFPQ